MSARSSVWIATVLVGLVLVGSGCSERGGAPIPAPTRAPRVASPPPPPVTAPVIIEQPPTPVAGAEKAFDLGNAVKLDMVWIAPGSFTMGSPSSEDGRDKDETQHRVELTKGCWLGKYEVTQAQWEAVMGSGSNPSVFKGKDLPVAEVSWDDCKGFIQKLNAKLSGEGGGFRLPTEAEWEYACRAGGSGRYCFGDIDLELGGYAWYGGNSEGIPHPVGTKSANAFGLFDMHGNVWEWCEDWDGAYPSGSVTDPGGPSTGSGRVLRGGAWYDVAVYCRSANRIWYGPGLRIDCLGFRLARTSPSIK